MPPRPKRAKPKVSARNHSVAVDTISVGGSVEGSLVIGSHNVVGFTSEQVSVLLEQISSTFQAKKFDGTCPYKGLDVFEEEDANLFFGREKLIEDLVSRLQESRTLFVTGPSGSGKSSLVRAGLIPALRNGAVKSSKSWLYETMKPGRDALGELARVASSFAETTNAEDEVRAKASNDPSIFARWCDIALKGRRDRRAVLFIDQFEEVFTQLSHDKAETFIKVLAHAATVENGRLILLFSMRSDFVANCATYPQLNALLNRQFVQIGAMQPEELVSAIAQPALRVGLKIDPDLIAQIIDDMKGEPGALPLMQFALKDLFDSQQAKGGIIALTREDYIQRGGIRKALERHADTSFTQLDGHEQELARSIFTKLIEIGRGTQDTRRTAIFDELIPANTSEADVQAIVQKLSDARLLTTDESAGKTLSRSPTKLIDAWPWLKKLVNENRDVIALQNEIAEDAKEWNDHQRDISYLYSGARLINVREQLSTKKLVLSGTASEFVQVGFSRQQREQRTRIFSIAGVIGLIIAGIILFSYISTSSSNKLAEQSQKSASTQAALASTSQANAVAAQAASTLAVSNEDQAKEQRNVALARQLAAQAQALFASKPQLGVLLGVQSMRLLPSVEAAQVLQMSTLPRQIASMVYHGPVHFVAFSPDGKYIASEGCDKYDEKNICIQGSARVSQVATGEEVAHVTFDGEVYNVVFSPDGKYVVSEGCDKRNPERMCIQGSARVWEAVTGKEIARMTHDSWVRSVAFSRDGKYLVSGSEDKTVRVWEAVTGKEIARMTHEDVVNAVAFSPDGKYVASASNDYTARVWEVTTGKEVARVDQQGWVSSVAFSPDGKYVVSGDGFVFPRDPCMCGGGGGGSAWIWIPTTGRVVARTPVIGDITSIALSPDGKYIVSGARDNTARVSEVSTGKEVARMTHEGSVNSVAFSPDGKYVVSGSDDNTARVWETATGKEIARMTHDGNVNSVAFSPEGRYVISGSQDNTASVWEAGVGQQTTRVTKIDIYGYSVTFSPDGKHLASLISCNTVDSNGNCTSLARLSFRHRKSCRYNA
jgi:WD40 repeat protein/energy-coupling factor transporter ATP-binding protein EcfA2